MSRIVTSSARVASTNCGYRVASLPFGGLVVMSHHVGYTELHRWDLVGGTV